MDEMVEDAVVNGSSVTESSMLFPYELKFGKWYRSKGTKVGDSPFASYLLNNLFIA